MKTDNFISFSTICGFFVGLIFSLLCTQNAFDFVLFVLLIIFAFYILAHFVAINFINKDERNFRILDKKGYDEVNKLIAQGLLAREKRMNELLENSTQEENIQKIA